MMPQVQELSLAGLPVTLHILHFIRRLKGLINQDMAEVEEMAAKGREALRERLLAPDLALRAMPEVRLAVADEALRFTAGNAVGAPASANEGLVRVYGKTGEFLGVGELGPDGRVAPKRVFLTGEKNP